MHPSKCCANSAQTRLMGGMHNKAAGQPSESTYSCGGAAYVDDTFGFSFRTAADVWFAYVRLKRLEARPATFESIGKTWMSQA